MNVANLENCKKLYELSGWDDTSHVKRRYATDDGMVAYRLDPRFRVAWVEKDYVPAYDLGYLLRKLPVQVDYEDNRGVLLMSYVIPDSKWRAALGNISRYADTPEDAACLLAIKLFEEGVLTPNIKKG